MLYLSEVGRGAILGRFPADPSLPVKLLLSFFLFFSKKFVISFIHFLVWRASDRTGLPTYRGSGQIGGRVEDFRDAEIPQFDDVFFRHENILSLYVAVENL